MAVRSPSGPGMTAISAGTGISLLALSSRIQSYHCCGAIRNETTTIAAVNTTARVNRLTKPAVKSHRTATPGVTLVSSGNA